jgi:hypothetical protein
LNTAIDEAMAMIEGCDDHALARDIIAVHGADAAAVVRVNARAAALAGQAEQAKFWIRVLGIIQRHQAGERSPIPTTPDTSPGNVALKYKIPSV